MHPDGTVSVLRAGITRILSAELPVPFKGTLVAFFRPDLGDLKGTHSFDLRCVDQDGNDQVPTVKGSFASQPSGGDGVSAVALEMQAGFKKYGKYLFVIRVDNHIEDEWAFIVGQPPKQEAASKPD